MNTWQKGEIAICRVIERALEKDYIPCKPVLEQVRYDLIIDTGVNCLKAQVKYCDRYIKSSNTLVLSLYKRTRNKKDIRLYNNKEIDIILVYVPKLEKILILDSNIFSNKAVVVIRLELPKNNQKKKILMYNELIW